MTSTHVPPITEEDIANFLTNTPGFFERHAEVLASVQITSPHGQRAVSLQERQAEMLREKIKGLEHRIMDMVRNSNDNTAIATKVHQWTSALLRVKDPFDLPEAESELVAGFMVEYSSTPYLLFMAGEYIAIFLMCALISILFFGGWLSPIPGIADGWWWMVAKMWLFFFLFAMVKAIVPRYRYDQLMRIGWKVFLPLSIGWVVLVSFLAKFEILGGFWARWAVGV